MKHATVKVTKAAKIVSREQKNAQKISNLKTAKSASGVELKTELKLKDSAVKHKKINIRPNEPATTAPAKSKPKTEKNAGNDFVIKDEQKKSARVVSVQKTELKKSVKTIASKLESVSVKSKNDGKNLEPLDVTVPKKQEKSISRLPQKQKSQKEPTTLTVSARKSGMKIQKTNPIIPAAKSKLNKEKTTSEITAKENKQAQKHVRDLAVAKNKAKIPKIKPFFEINKLRVIVKKTDLPTGNTDKKSEKAHVSETVALSPQISVEPKIEARSSKPKKAKPIGAAVFRGRKERYDFQVYPIDAEFVDVPAIYVISKRKTDQQKRAHHALVCIGQTDSVLGEIKKHKNKCIKKHKANVISILTEENEKKRLKIEEDLKAAHVIVCNI